MSDHPKIPAVSMRGITKRFGSVTANNHCSLDIQNGEILALLGENGSGKTTLMNMLAGLYYPDEGQIFLDGKEVSINSPHDAFSMGIGMVHQHFKLVDVLTATENIILGIEEKGKLDLKAAAAKIRSICETYGFDLNPDQKIYDMSVSQKQTVEIVKVLYRGARILILDEPTAVLTPQETDRLFTIIHNMKDDGKAIVIITHKLNEVKRISDRVAILRKGECVGVYPTSEISIQEMTDRMVGHKVVLNIERPVPKIPPEQKIFIRNLTVVDEDGLTRLDHVSFYMNTSEILGVAGISGSGQKELLESIAGLQKVQSGSIEYKDDNGTLLELVGRDPLEIARLGITLSFVPEDRLGMGLVGDMDITDNIMLRSFRDGRSVFTDRRTPKKLAGKIVNELDVKTPSLATPVRKLSGGNVQKVLVGREIASAPRVLLTAYAVRGLDINSAYQIYDLLNQQKERGVAVLYVGEDLDVLMALCDKIMVLAGGKLAGIVDPRVTTKEAIGLMMAGGAGKEEQKNG